MRLRGIAVAMAIMLAGAAAPPLLAAIQYATPGPGHPLPPRFPDLVIHKFELLGHPKVKGDHIEVSVAIGVRNQGDGQAGTFNVEVEYAYANPAAPRTATERRGPRPELILGPHYVPFIVAGSSPTWGPLAPGQPGYYKGDLVFPPTVRGVTVLVRTIADPCSRGLNIVINGVHYCHVIESDESNNASVQLSVALP